MTPLLVAGMASIAVELIKVLPGGVEFPDVAAQESVEHLDDRAEEKRLRRLDRQTLDYGFEDAVHVVAYLALFSDETLVQQLVPTGSKWRTALSQAGFVGREGGSGFPRRRSSRGS